MALLAGALTACPHPIARPYPAVSAEVLFAHVRAIRQRIVTLRAAQATSDSWQGNKRVKLDMGIMAAWGGRLRLQVYNPNDSLAADLASDGEQCCFVDTHENCGDCGPATAHTVARLLRIALVPDDLVAVLFGSTPLLSDANATLTWDDRRGHEVLSLSDGGYTQRVELAGHKDRWDVLSSELRGPDGKRRWLVRHFDFREVVTGKGTIVRLPEKSNLVEGEKDVKITWNGVEADVDIAPDKFHLDLQPGLPVCGAPRP